MDLSHYDSYGKSYDNRPKVDLEKAMLDLTASFFTQKCGHCGKEYFRTYFIICPDCLTLKQTKERRITTAST